ncbi:hypothetical protein HerbRD11066_78590 [Herbidospora sp. RD11066]
MGEKVDHQEEEKEEFKHQYATEPKLFGSWSYEGVKSDRSHVVLWAKELCD